MDGGALLARVGGISVMGVHSRIQAPEAEAFGGIHMAMKIGSRLAVRCWAGLITTARSTRPSWSR